MRTGKYSFTKKALATTLTRQHCHAGLMRRSVINEHVSLNAGGFLTKLEKIGQSKEASILWSHHEETREKEIMQETMPGARRRGRPRTAWMDNIKTWTGLSVEESIRMTEDRDKLRKYVHCAAYPRIEDG